MLSNLANIHITLKPANYFKNASTENANAKKLVVKL